MEYLESIFGTFPYWLQVTYITLQWVFIIANIILVIVFIFATKKALEFRMKFRMPVKLFRKRKKKLHEKNPLAMREWKRIQKKVREGSPQAFTVAIIEADKLVDELLRQEGLSGDFMAERLEQLRRARSMKTLEKIWQAHRIRNNLVHTPGFQISPSHAEDMIKTYEAFLKEFGAI